MKNFIFGVNKAIGKSHPHKNGARLKSLDYNYTKEYNYNYEICVTQFNHLFSEVKFSHRVAALWLTPKNYTQKLKKLSLIASLLLFIGSNAFADDILTGDTKLACEAILCLSSGTRPSECSSSLARYFSIKFKKPWKTINARRAFLNLCPIQNDANIEDLVLNNLVDDVLPVSDPRQCTPNYLNTQVETKRSYSTFGIMSYRINPNMPNFCHALINHAYTDYKTPKYKCTGEFYNSLEWKLSAKLQLITQQAYESLSDDQRYMISRTCGDRNCYDYYQKIPFTKECWTY
ncbi:TrbM/KikA/MpfK family conjugal transfer protein [Campylobacter coli]|uniref:TrbM/KikA/MpfK family conjugal transfer protein n=1 Tax=Campylobacter TaxID=194 RepID=UPI000B1D8147|nr:MULTISPECIES: TrbM/KikA/MpfK family conjugal transfer protein [Campylobacter]MCE7163082.1 conjugal transfer protein TrbM [Campylobacter coli]MCH3735951.1 conjugal transfer protein TrbM [Campylobacter coli]MDN2689613.1 TrbM/KikA/MpfK family conjugal transfer protein [Campylobacter coli]MDN2738904.1 TrbM/KikA/MpfK family conjugal transfer protein [Campylobacter coli]MDN2863873.1 TrbM/KikA/MpfK family conjugal transfer protein [Campylobacter coli]